MMLDFQLKDLIDVLLLQAYLDDTVDFTSYNTNQLKINCIENFHEIWLLLKAKTYLPCMNSYEFKYTK